MASDAYLFEVSWEVANKIGGIYTVIKSKTAHAINLFPKYFVVGPYFPDKNASEFIEESVPEEMKKPFSLLKGEGISCHYGRWLTDVDVPAILIDFSGFASRKNEIKTELWNNYRIDSLNTSYFDFDEPVIWAYAAGRVVHEVSKGRKAIAHCHEWLSAAALLYLKSVKSGVATVFTTHATVLGRTLSGAGVDIYDSRVSIDADRASYDTGVYAKHQAEKSAALSADIFTTVSEITSIEAERFLGRKADVLLLNGLNLDKFPTFEEASIRHHLFKGKIKEFLIYCFFPYYRFDLENTLIYFFAGRQEVHAKGIDLFIDSLAELNRKLSGEKSNKTVIAFFWVPVPVRGVKASLIENRTFFNDVKDSVRDEHDEVMQRMLISIFSSSSVCDENYLLGASVVSDIRRKLLRFKGKGVPPLSTHDLQDENNEILNAFRSKGLLNGENDRVKVILYPIYLTGADNLLDLAYYEAMQGSHLGVFPSLYEPWGYTPVEAAAMGVPSVTTDLSGFGRYICRDCYGKAMPGVFVIKRMGISYEKSASELAKVLYRFAKFDNEERIKNKIRAKQIASVTDWKLMIRNYMNAYAAALKKKGR